MRISSATLRMAVRSPADIGAFTIERQREEAAGGVAVRSVTVLKDWAFICVTPRSALLIPTKLNRVTRSSRLRGALTIGRRGVDARGRCLGRAPNRPTVFLSFAKQPEGYS